MKKTEVKQLIMNDCEKIKKHLENKKINVLSCCIDIPCLHWTKIEVSNEDMQKNINDIRNIIESDNISLKWDIDTTTNRIGLISSMCYFNTFCDHPPLRKKGEKSYDQPEQ